MDLFTCTRARSQPLAAPLFPEDMMLQSMEDASPVRWHMAHTTWFFEEFILKPRVPNYSSPDDRFAFLFNSYYTQAGPTPRAGPAGPRVAPISRTASPAY